MDRIKGSSHVLFWAYFLDFLGFALIVPILPLLVLDDLFAMLPEITQGTRYILLGLLLSSYPLAQMVSAPFLGALSDEVGRKNLLVLSHIGNIACYVLYIAAIRYHLFPLLFVANIISGLFGMNRALTHTMIADGEDKKKRRKQFSLTHLLLSLSFVLSPLLSKWLIYITPSLKQFVICALGIAASIALFNALILIWRVDETALPTREKIAPKMLLKSLKAFITQERQMFPYFSGIFCFFFAWYGFIKFFQVHCISVLALDVSFFYTILTWLGLTSCIMQLGNYFLFHSKLTAFHAALISTALLSLSMLLSAFCTQETGIILVTIAIATCHSLAAPNLMYFGSHVKAEDKGKSMALYQSMQSLAKTLAPTIAGITMAFVRSGSMLLSSLMMIACFACLRQYSLNTQNGPASDQAMPTL